MPKHTALPYHHLAEGSVDVDADHTAHANLLSLPITTGAAGRRDNYGFALSAQPGESQRWPATNSSSKLMHVDRPARTFVLPVPLSRMLAAYTSIWRPG
jgi:hypothetical protein